MAGRNARQIQVMSNSTSPSTDSLERHSREILSWVGASPQHRKRCASASAPKVHWTAGKTLEEERAAAERSLRQNSAGEEAIRGVKSPNPVVKLRFGGVNLLPRQMTG